MLSKSSDNHENYAGQTIKQQTPHTSQNHIFDFLHPPIVTVSSVVIPPKQVHFVFCLLFETVAEKTSSVNEWFIDPWGNSHEAAHRVVTLQRVGLQTAQGHRSHVGFTVSDGLLSLAANRTKTLFLNMFPLQENKQAAGMVLGTKPDLY